MHIWGKVFGFLFGFMLSRNIVGALLGMWLGHTFDKGRAFNFTQFGENNEANRQTIFFETTFSVMGFMAKANGRVSEHEIAFANAYMDKLNLAGEMRQQAKDAFREGKVAGFPIEERLTRFRSVCGRRHDLLLMFLEIQIQVAFADGQLDNEERQALHTIARTLGFSAKELDQLLEMIIAGAQFHQNQGSNGISSTEQKNNAYKVLGVTKDHSDKEIKQAYRKLMSQHHPDKLVAKGLPPEMMDVAKQKAQDIQAAYELVSGKK